MHPNRLTRLSVALCLGLACGTWWLAGRRDPRPAGPAASLDFDARPARDAGDLATAGAPRRRPLDAPPAVPPGASAIAGQSAPSPDVPDGGPRERVRGRLTWGGVPLEDRDLRFVPTASDDPADPTDRDPASWDLTDEEGRFEVVLRPGRYAVHLGEDERALAVVEVDPRNDGPFLELAPRGPPSAD